MSARANPNTDGAPNSPTTARRSRLYLLGPALTLASMPAYMLLMDVAWLRSTGFAAFALMIAGTAVGVAAAVRDRRWRARIAAGFDAAVLVFGVVSLLLFSRLPEPAPPQGEFAQAIDFTLPDEHGQPVSLRSLYERGPTLLVFYRGHW